VRDLGFAILAGTGVSEGTVLRVAETFGYVRRTNYGELFDVRTELDPSNLAFTGLAISPHTDNPYRDPVPTLQLLHCVQNAVEGGDTGLVDGFLAASLLADESPADLRLLASTPVPFAWCDATNTLRAEVPLIELDCRGEPRCVRFNNRSMEAIAGTPESLAAFYDAYRHFAEIVTREELRLSFRLEGGDCLMFDNRRVLHARTAFVDDTGGSRHLQGCYADVDGLLSSIAVLERVPARQSDGVS
jgi:gamma-butyrobetaine dioxygenase